MNASKLITEAIAHVEAMAKEITDGKLLRELALTRTHLEDAQLRLLRYSLVEAQVTWRIEDAEGGDTT